MVHSGLERSVRWVLLPFARPAHKTSREGESESLAKSKSSCHGLPNRLEAADLPRVTSDKWSTTPKRLASDEIISLIVMLQPRIFGVSACCSRQPGHFAFLRVSAVVSTCFNDQYSMLSLDRGAPINPVTNLDASTATDRDATRTLPLPSRLNLRAPQELFTPWLSWRTSCTFPIYGGKCGEMRSPGSS